MKIQTAKIGVLALFNQEILYLNNNKPFLLIFSGSRMNSRESPDPTGYTFETMSIPGVPRVIPELDQAVVGSLQEVMGRLSYNLFLNDLFLYLVIDTVFHPSGIFKMAWCNNMIKLFAF